MTTLEAFVRESPVLAAVAGTIGAILLLLMLGALISNRRQKRRPAMASPPPRHEPDLYTTAPDLAAAAYVEGTPARAPDPPVVVRRGFGLAALTIAFVLGIAVGIGAMTTSRERIATALASLVAAIKPSADDAAGNPAPPAASPATDSGMPESGTANAAEDPAPAEPAAGPSPEVLARLSSLAARLEDSLPRPAGPDMTLTSVEVDGATLRLGYAVGRAMPESESRAFDAYVERTARSLFCDEKSAELSSLNASGVVFEMQYADPDGNTVTKLTVDQGFCA